MSETFQIASWRFWGVPKMFQIQQQQQQKQQQVTIYIFQLDSECDGYYP